MSSSALRSSAWPTCEAGIGRTCSDTSGYRHLTGSDPSHGPGWASRRELAVLAEDVGPDVGTVERARAFPGVGDCGDDAVAEGLARHVRLAAAAGGRCCRPVRAT